MNSQVVVTVAVITYNSSKFVLETLESIKAQTYQPLILNICDDCSTDNTVEICEKWIEKNKDRFIETKIIVPEHNTGIAGNLNRAFDACNTEWFKGIAGDDILKPNCLEENVGYVSEHPEAALVFSRVEVFGPSQERNDAIGKLFDYTFFRMTSAEQYDRLVLRGNCLPGATNFFNIKKMREMGIRADERIPLLEDYPMWINMLKKGVLFHFIDKALVCYRVGDGGISTGTSISSRYRRSLDLFYFYYLFPELYKKDADGTIQEVIKKELSMLQDIDVILRSPSYKLGNFILKPLKWMRDCLHL